MLYIVLSVLISHILILLLSSAETQLGEALMNLHETTVLECPSSFPTNGLDSEISGHQTQMKFSNPHESIFPP